MSEEITPEKTLDNFIEYLSSLPTLVGKTIGEIKEQNTTYSLRDIQEIIGKLKKDGYAWLDYESEMPKYGGEPRYISTFEGRLFIKNGGYTAKSLADFDDAEQMRNEANRVIRVDELNGQNQTMLNTLTNRLAWATWFAFGSAILLLLWQIYSYYHPITT